MKKTLQIMLIIFAVLTLLVACSDKKSSNQQTMAVNKTGFPIVDEEITIKMVGQKSPTQTNWDKMKVLNSYEEKTNIKIQWDTPAGDGYREKLNLMFASGEYPEAFFGGGLSRDDEIKYGSQEILVPLEDLIDEYAPNFKKILDDNPDIRRSITTPDGHIYALPTVIDVPRDLSGPKLWVNKKWIDDLGLEMPKSVDDLYTILKSFKENDPNGNGEADEIPIGSSKLEDIKYGLMGAFGYLGSNNFNAVDDKVVYVPSTEEYKEFLMYMNKLYEEGLLDKETFTQDAQAVTAKGQEMRLGLFMDAGAFLKVPVEQSDQYVALPPLTSSVNQELMWPRTSGISSGSFAITDKNPHPEATMRWVDYFYSEEGSTFIGVAGGVEGEDWEWIDEEKTKWEQIVPEGRTMAEMGAERTPAAGTFVPHVMRKEWVLKEHSPLNNEIDKEVSEKYEEYFKIPFPDTYYTNEEIEEVNAIQSDISDYVERMTAKFTVGEVSFDEWDQYTKQLNKLKLEQLIEIQQEAYDRWKDS
ncbi:putative aldouronate transport system substrate-binding protein [Lederbergia galactosidilyticus]|uniref:extracellular solute-binding protein n=1 Tax=Lederbergia galactosidilytica TaxID=217031 RepID=UPI001AEB8DE3|nr:extracellular solute-binding protein [Lederbergia galactosidilytica]MBP1916438.1 putative aldouronate transport system substrate-binding protein [Lederbergia galactosidilytica]